jgi:hypothetical protein
VYFDDRNIKGKQGIADGDAGVSIGSRIDNNSFLSGCSFLDLFDNGPLTIGLKGFDKKS